jgi:hypothetical protein
LAIGPDDCRPFHDGPRLDHRGLVHGDVSGDGVAGTQVGEDPRDEIECPSRKLPRDEVGDASEWRHPNRGDEVGEADMLAHIVSMRLYHTVRRILHHSRPRSGAATESANKPSESGRHSIISSPAAVNSSSTAR